MICQLATPDDRRPCTGLGLPPYTIITHSVKKRRSVESVCVIWGYVKNKEFVFIPPIDIAELKQRIKTAINGLDSDILTRFWGENGLPTRCASCD
ncbi:hypothetical protein TNCV_3779131 [Trichonephila clavipes]|nr:hypothetical protein TNCV_3779131 [Trichonephila clavipes]